MLIDVLLPYILQGSWKESLRTSFKNFRRDRPEELQDGHTPKRSRDGEPPSKRLKTELAQTDLTVELSDGEYEQAMLDLQVRYAHAVCICNGGIFCETKDV